MARRNPIQLRLSDREVDMQKAINKLAGATSMSEGIRLSIAHTYIELIVRKSPLAIKPGEVIQDP